jgi:hypothetical protein
MLAAVLGAVLVGAAGGLFWWARTATDSSQFARALVWGESAYGDQHRFPSLVLRAPEDPVSFESVSDSPVAGYTSGSSDLALEDLLENTDTTAFIVIHGDSLLYEGYFNDSIHEDVQTSFSVAKSFVATLVGIAIDEGSLPGLDEPMTRYVPELLERDARFGDITLRHLITMSSGLSFDDTSSPWGQTQRTRTTAPTCATLRSVNPTSSGHQARSSTTTTGT